MKKTYIKFKMFIALSMCMLVASLGVVFLLGSLPSRALAAIDFDNIIIPESCELPCHNDYWQKSQLFEYAEFTQSEDLLKIQSYTLTSASFDKRFVLLQNQRYYFFADVYTTSTSGNISISIIHNRTRQTLARTSINRNVNGWQTLSIAFPSGQLTGITFTLNHGTQNLPTYGITKFQNIRVKGPEYNLDNNWNILGVVIREIDVDVTVNRVRRNVNIKMNDRDINIAKQRFRDLERSLNVMSGGQMVANVTTIVIETPLTEMRAITTTMGGVGYAPRSIELRSLVQSYVDLSQFNHVMAFMRTACSHASQSVPTSWAGLYTGVLDNIHWSQVIFSQSRNCTWHERAFFPERTLIHEFLHGLERISIDRGINVPCIDAPRRNYGYGTSLTERFRFYLDFMNRNVAQPRNSVTQNNVCRIGLSARSYQHKRPTGNVGYIYSLGIITSIN
ncbi:MAG: hypothetical protein FWE01_02410 [Firmicutes bacterium]|nr:hypothetical protein [Bacillota bacterium]